MARVRQFMAILIFVLSFVAIAVIAGIDPTTLDLNLIYGQF
jgi:hypothetical protein